MITDAMLDADIAILARKGSGKTYTAKGLVEQDGWRVEGRARFMRKVFAGGRTRSPCVLFRIDGGEDVSLAFVLNPRWRGRVDHAAGDGDELSREEAEIGLPVLSIHRDGAVSAHTAANMDGKR